MLPLRKYIHIAAASAMLAIGSGAVSNATAQVFKVNPNSNGLSSLGSIFSADFINGGSTALVSYSGSGTTYTSDGYITYGQFTLSGSPVAVGTSRLGLDYGLYATFSQTFTCSGLLGIGVTCNVNTISLSLFADPGNLDTYVQASLPSTTPSVTDVGSNDVQLGTATAVVSGVAGINVLGGAFENVNTNFILTAAGSNYFIDPVPFYNFAFSNFNNTSLGLACDTGSSCVAPTKVAITSENGGSAFLRVPEPASLALVGIALIGLGLTRRKGSAT